MNRDNDGKTAVDLILEDPRGRQCFFAGMVTVLLMGLIIIGISKMGRPDHIGLWATEYTAEMSNDYNIEINESEYLGYTPSRIVHLNRRGNRLVTVSGHDDNMDGSWERIFIYGNHETMNSRDHWIYNKTKNGWELEEQPDPIWVRAENTMPLTNAIAMLDEAMKNRTVENLSTIWTRGNSTNMRRLASR